MQIAVLGIGAMLAIAPDALALAAPMPLVVTMSISQTHGLPPVVSGTTNLPDGTSLSALVFRPGGPGLFTQVSSVSGGMFQIKIFPPQDGAIPYGTYSIEIISTLDQPPSVRATIGASGQYLSGSLVKPYAGQNSIDFISQISVP